MKSRSESAANDRWFALASGLILLAIALLLYLFTVGLTFLKYLLSFLGLVLMIAATIVPEVFIQPDKPLNLWMRFGHTLHQVTTPILLALVYFGCFMPAGLVLKIRGKDPLRRKPEPESASYWIKREPPGPDRDSIKMQF